MSLFFHNSLFEIDLKAGDTVAKCCCFSAKWFVGFILGPGNFLCVKIACSHCACVGCLGVLQLPPNNMHKRQTGKSKLAKGVSTSANVNGLSLCGPSIN